MQQANPYQPPRSENELSGPRPRFQAGLVTARYLQVLGCLAILAMLAGPVFFDYFYIDGSPILLFWAASNLTRNGRRTRTIVINLCIIGLVATLMLFLAAVVVGTAGMQISLFGVAIRNPELWEVFVCAGGVGVLFGIPLVLLLSPQAKRQFGYVSGD